MLKGLSPHHLFTRFILPLGFAALGCSVCISGAMRVAEENDRTFGPVEVVDQATKGVALVGTLGAALGLAIDRHYLKREKELTRKVEASSLTKLKFLTGVSTLPDDTRALIQQVIEDVENSEN